MNLQRHSTLQFCLQFSKQRKYYLICDAAYLDLMQNYLNCLPNTRSAPNVNFLQAALRQVLFFEIKNTF
jgi:hypothetical protein